MRGKELHKNYKNLFKAINIMAHIDYSSDSSNGSKSSKNSFNIVDNEVSFSELHTTNTVALTASSLKNHEKKFENATTPELSLPLPLPTPLPLSSMSSVLPPPVNNIQEQIFENNNTALVYGFAENLEILRNMNEEIQERLDWVTQQTQQIKEQFDEDREEARKERKRDRILGMSFSFLETTLFFVGIIYATILFLIEMYYSVSFNFI